MIQFYIDKKHKSRRVIYVLDFLGRVLGYGYKIIFDKKGLDKTSLVITYNTNHKSSTKESYKNINIFNSGQIEKLSDAERNINLFKWDKLSIPVIGKNFKDVEYKGWRENKNNYFSKTGIETWQTSGLSVRQFCKQEGLSEPSFYNWRKKLTPVQPPEADQEKVGPSEPFIRVSLPAEAPDGLELVFSTGNTLRMRCGVDRQTLTGAISVLQEANLC